MQRRLLLTAAAVLPLAARAHHGWSSFDTGAADLPRRQARNVAWRNPHVELDLDVAPDLKLPADLAQRGCRRSRQRRWRRPAQGGATADAQGQALAHRTRAADAHGGVEGAEIKNGDAVSMLGFTFAGEKGDAVLRVEYLFVGGKTYGLRSSPA